MNSLEQHFKLIEQLLFFLKNQPVAIDKSHGDHACWEFEWSKAEYDTLLIHCAEQIILLMKHIANEYLQSEHILSEDVKWISRNLTSCSKEIHGLYKMTVRDKESCLIIMERALYRLRMTVQNVCDQDARRQVIMTDSTTNLREPRIQDNKQYHKEIANLRDRLEAIQGKRLALETDDTIALKNKPKNKNSKSELLLKNIDKSLPLIKTKNTSTNKRKIQKQFNKSKKKTKKAQTKEELKLLSLQLLILREETIRQLSSHKDKGKIVEKSEELKVSLEKLKSDLQVKCEENSALTKQLQRTKEVWQDEITKIQFEQCNLKLLIETKEQECEQYRFLNEELKNQILRQRQKCELMEEQNKRNENCTIELKQTIAINKTLNDSVKNLENQLNERTSSYYRDRLYISAVKRQLAHAKKITQTVQCNVVAIKSDIIKLRMDYRTPYQRMSRHKSQFLIVQNLLCLNEKLKRQLCEQRATCTQLEEQIICKVLYCNMELEQQIVVNGDLKRSVNELEQQLKKQKGLLNIDHMYTKFVKRQLGHANQLMNNIKYELAAIKMETFQLRTDCATSGQHFENHRKQLVANQNLNFNNESLVRMCSALREELSDKYVYISKARYQIDAVKDGMSKFFTELSAIKTEILQLIAQVRFQSAMSKHRSRRHYKHKGRWRKAQHILKKQIHVAKQKLAKSKCKVIKVSIANQCLIRQIEEQNALIERQKVQKMLDVQHHQRCQNDSVSISGLSCSSTYSSLANSLGKTFGDRRIELLRWCQSKVRPYGIPIYEFCTSWTSGHALCALIHAYRPDLIDTKYLKCNNAAETLAYGVKAAESLGVTSDYDLVAICLQKRPSYEKVFEFVQKLYHCLELKMRT